MANAALPGKDGLIPGAVGFTGTLGIVTARGLTQPSLLQELGAKFSDGSVLFDLDVAEKAEALADGTGSAEFSGR